MPTSQGIVSATYGPAAPAALVHGPDQAVPVTGFKGAQPRVRARRGQATDPHSIAERTDKASMLDEIINYVKFLQLQLKELSTSRLGAAGAVAKVINDLPSEGPSTLLAATLGSSDVTSGLPLDRLALSKHQVARLMEEDISSAMQYLQSKGLCLMPISLASAISSSGTNSKADNQASLSVTCDRKMRSQSQAVMIPVSNNSLAMAASATSFTGVHLADGKTSESDSVKKVESDGVKQVEGCVELNQIEMSNLFRDVTASRSPKSSAEEFPR